jgi:hypothetical protein
MRCGLVGDVPEPTNMAGAGAILLLLLLLLLATAEEGRGRLCLGVEEWVITGGWFDCSDWFREEMMADGRSEMRGGGGGGSGGERAFFV